MPPGGVRYFPQHYCTEIERTSDRCLPENDVVQLAAKRRQPRSRFGSDVSDSSGRHFGIGDLKRRRCRSASKSLSISSRRPCVAGLAIRLFAGGRLVRALLLAAVRGLGASGESEAENQHCCGESQAWYRPGSRAQAGQPRSGSGVSAPDTRAPLRRMEYRASSCVSRSSASFWSRSACARAAAASCRAIST